MNLSEGGTGVFECSACGNVGLGDGDIVCCGESMVPVSEDDDFDGPDLEELLRTVFDMSDSELDICLCVMEGGDQTVEELAATTEFERSNVARHLTHLRELGVVERRRRLLKQGGHEYVYAPKDAEAVRRGLTERFVRWVSCAADELETVRREKVEGIVERNTTGPQWRIYREK
jgi:predicted transcriptional regulator